MLHPTTSDQCGYSGPRLIPNATFEVIPDVNFDDTFGTGEIVNGSLGYSKLVFGVLTIPKQEISALTYASVGGDPEGDASGLIGLSYSSLTAASSGTDPLKDIIYTCNPNASYEPVRYLLSTTTKFNNKLTKI